MVGIARIRTNPFSIKESQTKCSGDHVASVPRHQPRELIPPGPCIRQSTKSSLESFGPKPIQARQATSERPTWTYVSICPGDRYIYYSLTISIVRTPRALGSHPADSRHANGRAITLTWTSCNKGFVVRNRYPRPSPSPREHHNA